MENLKTAFKGLGIIISIKNNTFLPNYLGNSIRFITFASPSPLLS